ncbi:MAG: acylphosphatase [Actinomycetota bacterium]
MPAEPVRVHVWISGRVQGVFFRQETARRARAAGVAGWVRNLGDGRVEAVFEGEASSVDSVVDWARRGPPMARVDDLDVRQEAPQAEAGFAIH